MREMDVRKIREAVTELCLKANFELRRDILKALKTALKRETSPRAKNLLKALIENAALAKKKRIAICQDTGFVSVFIELGSSVLLSGGDLAEAVNRGVEDAYRKGYLRKSIVNDPILRKNTNTNTPSIIHIDIAQGDKVRISVSPKGFGSENKSAIKMLKPTASERDIIDFVLEVVKLAGPDGCPPYILGIGIGGTFDYAAHLSKRALLRPIGFSNRKRHFRRLEKDILKAVNSLGIGPMGLGGKTTALGVNVEEFPTHIAGLPVAVTVSCHATRSAEKTL
ncbi:MAG: fumarate hydratase [Candidatus Omnitrophica bacterium]|nr:fumarate hydratase [Candidatus Omnitrophota bacterium]